MLPALIGGEKPRLELRYDFEGDNQFDSDLGSDGQSEHVVQLRYRMRF